MLYNTKSRRGVAQFGSALGSGPRGRGFKSRCLNQKAQDTVWCAVLFTFGNGSRNPRIIVGSRDERETKKFK